MKKSSRDRRVARRRGANYIVTENGNILLDGLQHLAVDLLIGLLTPKQKGEPRINDLKIPERENEKITAY
jgi:hypothetical protein